jgi:hypothetical protein
LSDAYYNGSYWLGGSLTVPADATPPTITATAFKADHTLYTAGTWTNQTVKVHFSCSYVGTGIASCPAEQIFSTNGTFTASGTATDNAGNSATATFGPIKIDKTAPAPNCGAADGLWHADNISINCSPTDAGGSGLASTGAVTLSTGVADGAEDANASTDSQQVCDNAGNCATAGPVGGNMVDRKAPSLNCGAADGLWHASDVSIPCTSSDGGSGLANASDAAFSLSTSVPAGTETSNASTNSRSVCDAVGNCDTAGPVGGNKVDKKAPDINITVPNGGSYLLNQSVASSYTVTDGGSGVASSTPASGSALDTASVGSKTFAVTATDNVGNQSNASANYSVGYGVVALYDQTKSVKRGATIPIKVRLVDANGANVSSPAIVLNAVKLVLVGGGASDAVVSDQNNANSDGNFRYDASLGGYIFNLSTKNMGLIDGIWRMYFAPAGEPTSHFVQFGVVR